MLTSLRGTALQRAAAYHGRRHLAAAASVAEKAPKLCDFLENATLTYMQEPGRQREFAMGVIRPLASRAEEVAQLRSLSAVYGALEDALDDEATKSWSTVGRLWAGLPTLRRSDRLKADLEATGSMRFSDAADEHSLSVATRQYVRRVKAAKETDANLLIGHLFARHVLFDLGRLQAWKIKPADLARWTQGIHGYTPQRFGFDEEPDRRDYTAEEQDHYGYVASAVYRAMNAQEIDVDTLADVAQETQRSLQLTGHLLNERQMLMVGAARAVWSITVLEASQRFGGGASKGEGQ